MTKTRGRPAKVSDEKLMQMALDIKRKFKGQKLNFLLLERETGIGRQTWKRRISQYIDEINKPLVREYAESLLDEVFFPNIEELFYRYKNNKDQIISELHEFEVMFRTQYQELQSLKTKYEKMKSDNGKQNEALDTFKTKAHHYENLYKSIVLSSAFSHLREEHGIHDNLIQFHKQSNVNATLDEKQLISNFNNLNKTEEIKDDPKEKLASLFPSIFSEE